MVLQNATLYDIIHSEQRNKRGHLPRGRDRATARRCCPGVRKSGANPEQQPLPYNACASSRNAYRAVTRKGLLGKGGAA